MTHSGCPFIEHTPAHTTVYVSDDMLVVFYMIILAVIMTGLCFILAIRRS